MREFAQVVSDRMKLLTQGCTDCCSIHRNTRAARLPPRSSLTLSVLMPPLSLPPPLSLSSSLYCKPTTPYWISTFSPFFFTKRLIRSSIDCAIYGAYRFTLLKKKLLILLTLITYYTFYLDSKKYTVNKKNYFEENSPFSLS